ncbi:MAG: CRISPR-associated endonuclease Cas2 [Chloroflexota bacterium]|nr:CRISPR-associated endonuclease Cas2 [Chloroflexota bacterium]
MSTTTLYLIAYDIPDDKRRTKVHKILSGFGDWTQYSVFECFLDKRELVELRAKLHDILEPSEDSLRLYPVCEADRKHVETIGSSPPKEKTVYFG